jgi:hypothetical protein
MADRLEILVYEAIAPTFLITGHPADTISHVGVYLLIIIWWLLLQIQHMREIISKNDSLIEDFEGQIHCLLGMYATYFSEFEDAETQYSLAAKLTSDQELKLFSYLSLGLVHLCSGDIVRFYDAYDQIISLQTHAKNMRALVLFVNAVHNYLNNKIDDCK